MPQINSKARKRTPRRGAQKECEQLSQREKARKILRKKQAAGRKKHQKEVEIRERVAELLLEKLSAVISKPADEADRIVKALDKEIKRLRRKGQGYRPKELKRLAHIEKKAMTFLMGAFNEVYKQKNMRKHLPHPPKDPTLQTAKVVDMQQERSRVERHYQRKRKRAVTKVFDFLERVDTDPTRSLLVLLSDAGVKEIPTDMWFDESMDFTDIVYELVDKCVDAENLPVRKYQKIALEKRT